MSKEPVAVRYPLVNRMVFYLGGLLLLGAGSISLFLAFALLYLQVIPLFLALVFFCLAIRSLDESTRTLSITPNEVQSFTWLKRLSLPVSDVEGYLEMDHSNAKRSQKELIIRAKEGHQIQLYSDNWGEAYDVFRKAAARWLDRLPAQEKVAVARKSRRLYRSIGVGAGLLVVAIASVQVWATNTPDLVTISGTLSASPHIEEKRKGRMGTLLLQLIEYPEFSFHLFGDRMKLVDRSLADRPAGTKIELQVPRSDVAQKLEQTERASWQKRQFNWSSIPIYGIRIQEQVLLSAEAIAKHAGAIWPKGLLLLSGLMIVGYYQYFSRGYD